MNQPLAWGGKGLGRIPRRDARSASYAATDLYDPTIEPATKIWRRPTALDQADKPECVGFGFWGMINTQPHTAEIPYAKRTSLTPHEIYRGAKRNDEWAGIHYPGSSGLGACRFLHKQGFISGYRLLPALYDVLCVLSQHGPVAIGINWPVSYFDQVNIDPGYNAAPMSFDPARGFAGGHELELHGIIAELQLVVATNSWSTSWGDDGRCYITWGELQARLAEPNADAYALIA